jgi:antimicrobial peptide system SdpB family protein
MLTALGRWTQRRLAETEPWSNVYGLARTLLALGSAITLALSHSGALFRPAVGIGQVPLCAGVRGAGAFCLAAHHGVNLDLARWLAVTLLLVVATGWRPRATGLIHWWLVWSFQANAVLVDGGDQIAAVLTLLLIPVTLTDPRRSHWASSLPRDETVGGDAFRIVATAALFLVRVQVAGIYFQALVGKLAVEEWADGTALYYWLTEPSLGAARWLAPTLDRLMSTAWVAPFTWSVLFVECLLFVGLFLPKSQWSRVLVTGLALHAGIVIIHGLASFGFTMFAALLLYLRPAEEQFSFSGLRRVAAAWRPRRTGRPVYASTALTTSLP